MTLTFTNAADALKLPPPTNKDSHDIKHATQRGFYVRVMKPDTDGRIRRSWVCRYSEPVPDGKGGFEEKDRKKAFGLVAAIERGDPVIAYEDALAYVLQKRKTLRSNRVDGNQGMRMTVGQAMEAYPKQKAENRPRTLEKDLQVMERYFGHIKESLLDELNYAFWSNLYSDLKAGTLNVGYKELDGHPVPIMLGPLATTTLVGVLNAAIVLYEIAHRFKGLQGMSRDDNPPRDVKQLMLLSKGKGRLRGKKHLLKITDLGKAWLAANALVPSHWRDLFKVCVLTGLRRSLVWSMRFDEIDFQEGVYNIDPRKEGTKQRGMDFGDDPEPIRMPLSSAVLKIVKERRIFAPDKNGPVWYAPGKNQGRRRMDSVLGDQRSSWAIISDNATGYTFGPQDLRRTFATLGSLSVKEDLFAVALLMMHSSTTLARTVGLPEITIRYINTPSAQVQMRDAAEKISSYVSDLVAKAAEGIKLAADVAAAEVPQELEAAVGSE